MVILALTVFLFLNLPQSHAAAGCPSLYVPNKDKCYFVNINRVGWTDARTHCQNHGGDLVSINNMEEQKFLLHELNKIGSESMGMVGWITYDWAPTHPYHDNWYSVFYNPVYYYNDEHHLGRWASMRIGSYPSICETNKV